MSELSRKLPYEAGSYVHEMGIREGGSMAILAGAGPMGLGAIDYAVHCDENRHCLSSLT